MIFIDEYGIIFDKTLLATLWKQPKGGIHVMNKVTKSPFHSAYRLITRRVTGKITLNCLDKLNLKVKRNSNGSQRIWSCFLGVQIEITEQKILRVVMTPYAILW